MKSWIIRSALMALLLPLPREAFAQISVGFSVAGILSVQPVNDDWVGSPYLDEGIGGTQSGVAAGVDIVLESGPTVIGEISTARTFEQCQRGRLIWANRSTFSVEGRRHFALTGGVDFLQRLSSRAAFVIGVRVGLGR